MDEYVHDVSRLHADLVALRNELREQGMLTAVLDQRLKTLEADVDKLSVHADTHYVSLARYMPVEKVMFGMIGLILASFVAALWALLVRP